MTANISSIGAFTSFGREVMVTGADHPHTSVTNSEVVYMPSRGFVDVKRDDLRPQRRLRPLVIGSDVWIGSRAVILPGITIGHGAVIAAGAVVTKDVAPYTIVAGVPARPIRRRFPQETADLLLASRWWEWDDETIRARLPEFEDVEAFARRYGRQAGSLGSGTWEDSSSSTPDPGASSSDSISASTR